MWKARRTLWRKANCIRKGEANLLSFALEIPHGFTFLSGKVSLLLHALSPVQR